MGKEKIVFDTNVIISAFGWNGTPRKLFLLAAKKHEIVTSEKQLEEIQKALSYPKLRLQAKQQQAIIDFVLKVTTTYPITKNIQAVPNDPDDNVILETAVSAKATYIVTGDKHLLTLNKYESTSILNPRTLYEKLGAQ